MRKHTWSIIFRAIPHTSMLQQLVSACAFLLLTVPDDNRDFLDLVAVNTTVNCIRDHAQIPKVKYTSIGSRAILSSLKESKNSMISAAVPMYTSKSWLSWSRVRSPFGNIHLPTMRTSIKNCSIRVTHVSVEICMSGNRMLTWGIGKINLTKKRR